MLTLSLLVQAATRSEAKFFSLTSLLRFTFSCLMVTSSAMSSLFFASAHAADTAGRVIMARGDVTATGENGVIRNLKRRDSIFNHEIIKTGNESKVQIRFTDNTLLALKPNSELNINSYIYSEDSSQGSPSSPAQDSKVIMELVAGGFRTLTGKIGKGNKEVYQVNTPAASIGIRGTLYEIQIVDDGLLAAAWKGGISIATQQGQFDLGMDADFDFGKISDSGTFTGLLSAPGIFAPQVPMTSSSKAADNSLLELTDPSIPSPFEKDEDAFSVETIRNAILQQTQDGQLILTEDLKKQFEQEPSLFNDMLEAFELEKGNLSNPPIYDDHSDGHHDPDTSYPSTNYPNESTPNASIPSTSTPNTSIPSTSIPSTSIPSTSIPSTSYSDTLPDPNASCSGQLNLVTS